MGRVVGLSPVSSLDLQLTHHCYKSSINNESMGVIVQRS